MLAWHRRILVASATTAILVCVFVAVSAKSETAQSVTVVHSAALPESAPAPAAAPQASMVQTAVIAEPRGTARKAESRRHVVQNLSPSPPRLPLILGIHH